MRYRGAGAGALLAETLDAFTAVFHRPSGTTHLLVSPAPEILDALGNDTLDRDVLIARLRARYDLADETSLDARLAELAEAGLIAAA